MVDHRRYIPRTDNLLAEEDFVAAVQRIGRPAVKSAIATAQHRARIGEIAPADVAEAALAVLPRTATNLHGVINATGVIVHTNLGRAPLSPAAREAVQIAAGCTDVEFDLVTGQRARRGRGALSALSEAVPEAAGVHIVNNNAAALLLCAMVLAAGKEIVVSRGELVEIGDGFRIPELLASTGAVLREVGTTNRTHLRDYRNAIGPDTGFVLKVHPSNFHISGFTAAVEVSELVGLGSPVVVDIGSGLLSPHPLLPDEPDARSVLKAGAAVVTASGDKLLGGPQAGLLLGDHEIIEQLRRHPVARALRVDKLTLAALEATVRSGNSVVRAALTISERELRNRALNLVRRLADKGIDVDMVDTTAAIGGGGAPGVTLPSVGIGLTESLAAPLRASEPPIVGRLERGRCLLDLRTVNPDQDEVLLHAIQEACRTQCT